MLAYHPKKRITIKELLNHQVFKEHFNSVSNNNNISTLTKTAKMDRICIPLQPKEISSWDYRRIIDYLESIFDHRRSILDDLRKDLIILANNMAFSTPVPIEIWINILMLSNEFYVYLLRSIAKLDS
eukprot:TRINITY_DN4109_c0_g1_i1.p2 TRINITY_DN4109_c0_g1~~TRINITY_DN4109_c0_g1_i1.p2  ORF type:complete len:127 (-),score=8.02 TRINITY_DN4109_c0_g1_i1:8-388(-)